MSKYSMVDLRCRSVLPQTLATLSFSAATACSSPTAVWPRRSEPQKIRCRLGSSPDWGSSSTAKVGRCDRVAEYGDPRELMDRLDTDDSSEARDSQDARDPEDDLLHCRPVLSSLSESDATRSPLPPRPFCVEGCPPPSACMSRSEISLFGEMVPCDFAGELVIGGVRAPDVASGARTGPSTGSGTAGAPP